MMKRLFDSTAVRFVLVGIVNTLFGAGIMFVFYNCLHLNYWLSSASNYLFGSILSYFLNKYFTFECRERSMKYILRFAVNILVCYFVAYSVAKPLIAQLITSTSVSVQENVAMLAGMVIFTVLNYFGQKLFAFKKE